MAPCLWHHHALSPTLYTKSVHGLKYTSPTSQDVDEGNARASSQPGQLLTTHSPRTQML